MTIQSANTLHHSFSGIDGTELYGRSFLADSPVGDTVIQHGLGEYSGRYAGICEELLERNINVHLADLRGHGRSSGRRGDAESVLQLALDLELFFDHLKEETGLQSPVLTGHSLGGAVAATFALRHSNQFHLEALALSACPFLIDPDALQRTKAALGRFINLLKPDLILNSSLNPDDLSHDPEVVSAYRSDSLVHGKLSVRLGLSILDSGAELLNQASRLTIPLWAGHGSEDRITAPAGTEQFYTRVRSADRSLCIYSGLSHEIFNEPDPEPTHDLVEFVEQRFR